MHQQLVIAAQSLLVKPEDVLWTEGDGAGARKMLARYKHERIVVVLHSVPPAGPELLRRKFVTPSATTAAQLIAIVRARLDSSEALFLLFADSRTLVPMQTPLSELCDGHADEDGVLHLICRKESVFG